MTIFLWKVWKSTHNNEERWERPNTFRRFCKLSILTFESISHKVHGFVNTPHVDRTDNCSLSMNNEARSYIGKLGAKHSNYFQSLMVNDKLHVPTVCGYDIIRGEDQEENLDIYNAFFAMLGLGISVKLCPKVFHFFMQAHSHIVLQVQL